MSPRLRPQEPLEKRLFSYAVVAGAGLAAMQTAQASVIHVTPNGSPITIDSSTAQTVFDVNLDGDSTNDFTLTVDALEIRILTPGTNAVVLSTANSAFYADRLPGGTFLPGGFNFQIGPGQALAYGYSGLQFGPWTNGNNGFLGLRFENITGTHYGWLQGSGVISGSGNSFTITDWAYESCPGVGITTGATSGGGACDAPSGTPEPSTMGLLALGALGLPLLRRRKARQ